VDFLNNLYKCEFKKSGFQHREDGMKLGNEERSVVGATWAPEDPAEFHIRCRV